MSPIALVLCVCGTALLLLLDRDQSRRSSSSLWLPVFWLSIVASRPASAWLAVAGVGDAPAATLDVALEGNSTDAAILSGLLAAGLIVLARRRKEARASLLRNPAVVVYFAYCLLSVVWSPFPDVAFKRYMRAVGDLVMVMVLLTDPHPVAAISRLFSRIGFVLLSA